jgi:hypothetical protein
MTETQQQAAVLGAVVALLIPGYGGRLLRKSSAAPEGASLDAVREVAPEPVDGRAELMPTPPPDNRAGQRDAQRARAAELAWGRDPFAPGGGAADALGGLALSGILWDAADPMAIINGELRRAGDDLGGVRVLAIAQDHVVVSDGTSTHRLFIAP